MKIAKQKTRHRAADRLALTVDFRSSAAVLPRVRDLTRWAAAALRPDVARAEVGLSVVDEQEGRTLNRDYRGKDYATNVLTFALNEGDTIEGMPLFGDIVLTASVVEREAAEQGKTLDEHYAHLVVHSMLHLQGYDHIEDSEAECMEALETVIVKRLGYPDPYGEEHA